MKPFLFSLALLVPSFAVAENSYPDANAIVSIGGPVTEIIYQLGEGDRIVARDTTSVFPEKVQDLPDVGYMRRLSAEGVLSVAPDLIVTRDTAGPPEALDQLRSAQIPMVEIHDGFSAESTVAAVRKIGNALGVNDVAEALATQLEADFAALAADVATGPKPRVLFILSNRGGRLNVAGSGTGANGVIELAGAINVMADQYEGYKMVADEAIISANPDVILMMASGGDHAARKDEIMSLAPITQTHAGAHDAFATVNPAALGFGPRTADLARELRDNLVNAADGHAH